jgi:hypothetical protein
MNSSPAVSAQASSSHVESNNGHVASASQSSLKASSKSTLKFDSQPLLSKSQPGSAQVSQITVKSESQAALESDFDVTLGSSSKVTLSSNSKVTLKSEKAEVVIEPLTSLQSQSGLRSLSQTGFKPVEAIELNDNANPKGEEGTNSFHKPISRIASVQKLFDLSYVSCVISSITSTIVYRWSHVCFVELSAF